ncbi:MAG TPA: hypothetical protein DEG71_03400 [Clostridiales bacterium]|nr:hypothetical protein [Clostridiales bacterium]
MKKYFMVLVLATCLFFSTACNKNSEKIQTRISADEISRNEYVNKDSVKIDNGETNSLAQKILKNKDVSKVIIIKNSDNILVGTRLKSQSNIENIYDFKDNIKQQIVDEYGNTRDITIITSNEVFKRLEKLASDIKNNKPITGFFEDISDMINAIIPVI